MPHIILLLGSTALLLWLRRFYCIPGFYAAFSKIKRNKAPKKIHFCLVFSSIDRVKQFLLLCSNEWKLQHIAASTRFLALVEIRQGGCYQTCEEELGYLNDKGLGLLHIMRKYITERVGILEIFQIIISIVIVALGFISFATDERWNNRVMEQGVNLCVAVNKEIERQNKSVLLQSECEFRLDIKSIGSCEPIIDEHYLIEWDDPFVYKRPGTEESKDIKSYINDHMRRRHGGEVFFIVSITLTTCLLVVHIILASCLKVIELRTKWNVALQAFVLFSCGFACMLLATSVNRVEIKYSNLAKKVLVCGMLRYCHRIHPHISKDAELLVDRTLEEADACQEVRLKESIVILLIMIIVTCCGMILWAMDLTTIYEEETDEQEEVMTRQNDLDYFLGDNQTVIFDNVGEEGTSEARRSSSEPAKNKVAETEAPK